MKLSIITVVYNGENFMEKTIQSIVNQTFTDYEYIIIDGKSNDKTLEIISNYKEKIFLISEKDSGIYDAMNKGLRHSKGDYVIFINCGDTLANENVLKEIFENESYNDADVIYGDTNIIDKNNNILHNRRHRPPKNLNWRSFSKGMLVCHQSFIAKRSLTENYDLNYKYSSDFDWCIKVLKKSKKILNANKVISNFMEGGTTYKTIIPGLKERFKIMKKNYGTLNAIFCNLVLGVKFLFFVVKNRWF